MKKLLSVIAIVLSITMLFGLVGCGNNDTNSNVSSENVSSEEYKAQDMHVACLKGPTGVGMAKLVEDAQNKKTANRYTFTIATAADEISGKIINGEINIASVPTNLAAKLHQKTNGKITMLAVNTLGVLSFLSSDESVKTVADLKGKTIYSAGEGSNPEYILKYVLKQNNIDPEKDVTIKFVATGEQLSAAMISGQATVAMVPEPAATTVLTKKNTVKRIFTVNDEWEKISDSKLMMGCVVALDSYIENNKEAVDKFLEEYKASIEFANKNLDDTAKYCETYGIVPSAAIAKAAIPTCNVTYVDKTEMKNSIKGYFEVLLSFDKTSIGGKLPADSFYYNAK